MTETTDDTANATQTPELRGEELEFSAWAKGLRKMPQPVLYFQPDMENLDRHEMILAPTRTGMSATPNLKR